MAPQKAFTAPAGGSSYHPMTRSRSDGTAGAQRELARLSLATTSASHSQGSSLSMVLTEPTPTTPSAPPAPFGRSHRAHSEAEAADPEEPREWTTSPLSVSSKLPELPDDDDSFTFEFNASDAGSDVEYEKLEETAVSKHRPSISPASPSAPHHAASAPVASSKFSVRSFLGGPLRHKRSERSISNLAAAGLMGAAAARPNTSLDQAVFLRIRNDTGCPLRLANWPTKISYRGQRKYRLSHFRGNYFDMAHFPAANEAQTSADFIIGAIKKSAALTSLSVKGPRIGWVYFDLLLPSGYLLHLQVFIALSSADTISAAMLGRFDLGSSHKAPMPSGDFFGASVDPDIPGVATFTLGKELLYERNIVDDSPNKPPIIVPRKRLVVTSFASHPHACVSILAGKDGRYHEGQAHPTQGGHAQGQPRYKATIRQTEHELGGINKAWTSLWVQHKGEKLFNRSAYIDPILGLVKDADKKLPLASTSETSTSFFPEHDLTLSFGFHDSGLGRRHFMYAYVTRDQSGWLGDLIMEDNKWLDVPFSRLVLAGSHDAGMYTSLHEGFIELLMNDRLKAALGQAAIDLGLPIIRGLVKLLSTFRIKPELAICNMSNTQKDTIEDQLRVGTRFFDFRPGFCFHDVIEGHKGRLHHQHLVVPGVGYVEALEQMLLFLAKHKHEIVAVELKSDGFLLTKRDWRPDFCPIYSMVPTKAELAAASANARHQAAIRDPVADYIQIGGANDLDRSIRDLLDENRRLLIIDRMVRTKEEEDKEKEEDPEKKMKWDWERSDSYDHNVYDTDDPERIVKRLEEVNRKSMRDYAGGSARSASARRSTVDSDSRTKPLKGCIYQLQATPTKSVSDDIAASLTYSKASSLLVYTKARVDPHTYLFVKDTHFVEPGLVVLLNDFVDPVCSTLAVEKSRQRTGIFRQ